VRWRSGTSLLLLLLLPDHGGSLRRVTYASALRAAHADRGAADPAEQQSELDRLEAESKYWGAMRSILDPGEKTWNF
jgi:hypothetical protein